MDSGSCKPKCSHIWDTHTGGDWKICKKCALVEPKVGWNMYMATPINIRDQRDSGLVED